MSANKIVVCAACAVEVPFNEMRRHLLEKHRERFEKEGLALNDADVFLNFFEPKREDLSKLAPGYYELSQDVVNPRPDRRAKSWTTVPTWKKGDRFVVVRRTYAHHVSVLHKVNQHDDISQVSDEERFNALYPHLVPIPDTVQSLYEQYGAYSMHCHVVAAELLRMEKVTLDDIRIALSRASGEDPLDTSGLFQMKEENDA